MCNATNCNHRTYTNNRDGRSIETELSREEILDIFAKSTGDDNWLWYWLAQHAERNRPHTEDAPIVNGRGNVKNALDFINDLFVYAVGSGLKNPMIRLHYLNRRFKIYLSAKGTVCIKTGKIHPDTKDPVGDEEYMGCLLRGNFLVARRDFNDPRTERKLDETEQAFIARLSDGDVVAFFAECSKDMDRCCYCGHGLDDARSKLVGYGPICADHWGLPWGDNKRTEQMPSFADCWNRAGRTEKENIRGMCLAVRQNPYDQTLWDILSDALNDAGHDKRLKMPNRTAKFPRAN